jgi:UDP-4-amino-4,6-dideoxy-N-acetyl-beta-L-altrosamine transaminase
MKPSFHVPYGRQSVSDQDIEAVCNVLQSDFLTQGPVVPAFEQALSSKIGARHAVAVSSATAALHLACLALDVGKGDLVWTSPNSFVASANCARLCGADVDFVDIDPQTFCMDAIALAKKLEDCRKNGKQLPKVVIPVHFAGLSCDMPAIHGLAQVYGFRIIEDASHAIGSKVCFAGSGIESYVGNCEFSDICVFSFHPVKIITTGEGGALLTQSDELASRLMGLRSHGITRNSEEMTEPSHGSWYYQMRELGLNYRLTDIQAALGLSQLERLDDFVLKRQAFAASYQQAFEAEFDKDSKNVRLQFIPKYCKPSFHLLVVQVQAALRKGCFDALRAAGFGVNVHYIPIHLQPYYLSLGFNQGDFLQAESYYLSAISLPLYPDMPKDVPRNVAGIIASNLS